MEKRNCTIALLASLILLFTGFAGASTIINYQGLLTDASGDPVPDSTYQITFSIWDDSTGGTQVWTSALTSVETINGHFSVDLGATEPLDRDMLGAGPVYLEIQVETEPPMDPRTRLNWVPYGAVAQRVLGDVETSEGSLTVQLEDAEQLPYINLNVDSAQANVMLSPGYSDGPGINMVLTHTFEADDASLLIRGGDPGSDGAPTFDFVADDSTASMMMTGPTDGPSVNMQVTLTTEAYDAGMTFVGAEGGPTLKAGADPDSAGILIIGGTPTEGTKSINMQANTDAAGIIVIDTQPTGEEKSINIGTSTDEAGIIVIDTKPTGDSAIVEMGANNGAELSVNFAEPLDNQAHGVGLAANSSLADINVYFAEPLDGNRQGVQIFSDSAGANINMYQELAEGEEIGTPMFSVNGSPSGVDAMIFNPQPEPPGTNPMMKMSTAPGNNVSFKMYQPQSEGPGDLYEAFVMSNTTNGGSRAAGFSAKMFQPQPEPPGIPAAIQMAAQTTNTLFDVFKYTQDPTGGMDSVGMHMAADSSEISMEFLQGANTWVKMYANADGGGMEFFDDGSEYMSTGPSPFYDGGDLKMYDSAQATSIIISSLGQVSIGTGVMGNILTIARNSSTDPIADAWTTYSSRRWKRNIEPIEGSLNKVMNLRGVSFEWKENGKEDIGLIAEEVAEVIPEVVAFEENGVDAKSVDYARLVALLIEATKEQQKEIEKLKSEIEELKTGVK